MVTASIIGGSGYTGGELLRLLLGHPDVEIKQVSSNTFATRSVSRAHPNLRGVTDLKFCLRSDMKNNCDVMFVAVPHGASMKLMPDLVKSGIKIIDLSADFRLRAPEDYRTWYHTEHTSPDLLQKFVYGMPELHRDEIRKSSLVAVPGCLATASILALYPLARAKVMDPKHIVIDAKVGSSAAGAEFDFSTHHPERSHVVRLYAAKMHRHTGEIEQELAKAAGEKIIASFSAHAIELVRGILATGHVFLNRPLDEKEIWKIYRDTYGAEPFIRLVKDAKGVYRLPEPKLLVGSNYCDVGFELDERGNRLIAVSAIDNLVKGGSGTAVQCMNLMFGLPEKAGLGACGFHPI